VQQPNPGGLRGNFGEVIDSDESLPSIFKRGTARGSGAGGGAGRGTGGGSGIGSGIDRGPSGADRPEPMILDNPMPPRNQLPAWLTASSFKTVTFQVRVLDTGAIGGIDMIESSGRPEVDAYYLEILSKWKFTPAIRGGKPIAAPFQASFGDMRQ
jgi:TonB family protein